MLVPNLERCTHRIEEIHCGLQGLLWELILFKKNIKVSCFHNTEFISGKVTVPLFGDLGTKEYHKPLEDEFSTEGKIETSVSGQLVSHFLFREGSTFEVSMGSRMGKDLSWDLCDVCYCTRNNGISFIGKNLYQTQIYRNFNKRYAL